MKKSGGLGEIGGCLPICTWIMIAMCLLYQSRFVFYEFQGMNKVSSERVEMCLFFNS